MKLIVLVEKSYIHIFKTLNLKKLILENLYILFIYLFIKKSVSVHFFLQFRKLTFT